MKRFFIILCLLLFVSTSFAGSTLFFRGTSGVSCDTLQEDNAAVTFSSEQAWGSNSNNKWLATRFQYGGADAKQICRLDVYLEKYGSPTGTLTFYIYGDEAGPDPDEGNVLGTSDTVDASTLPADESPDWVTVDFSTPTNNLSNGTYYWIVGQNGTVDGSNYVSWGYDTTADVEQIDKDADGVGPWTSQSSTDSLMFRIYSQ